MKKTLLIPIVTVLVIGGAGLTASTALAGESNSQQSSFVTRLAEKFGLNAIEVETFLEQEHATRHAEIQQEMQSRLETRLAEAVTAGTITEEQKQLILDKHAEREAEREQNMPDKSMMKDLTPEEREAKRTEMRSQHETKRAELEAWATEHGIDLSLLMPGVPEGPQGMPGGKSTGFMQ